MKIIGYGLRFGHFALSPEPVPNLLRDLGGATNASRRCSAKHVDRPRGRGLERDGPNDDRGQIILVPCQGGFDKLKRVSVLEFG